MAEIPGCPPREGGRLHQFRRDFGGKVLATSTGQRCQAAAMVSQRSLSSCQSKIEICKDCCDARCFGVSPCRNPRSASSNFHRKRSSFSCRAIRALRQACSGSILEEQEFLEFCAAHAADHPGNRSCSCTLSYAAAHCGLRCCPDTFACNRLGARDEIWGMAFVRAGWIDLAPTNIRHPRVWLVQGMAPQPLQGPACPRAGICSTVVAATCARSNDISQGAPLAASFRVRWYYRRQKEIIKPSW